MAPQPNKPQVTPPQGNRVNVNVQSKVTPPNAPVPAPRKKIAEVKKTEMIGVNKVESH